MQALIMVIVGAVLGKLIFGYVETPDPFDSASLYYGILLTSGVLGIFAGWFSDIPIPLLWISLALGILSGAIGNLWPLTLILLLIILSPSMLIVYLSRLAQRKHVGD